jgi:hypothetical protein
MYRTNWNAYHNSENGPYALHPDAAHDVRIVGDLIYVNVRSTSVIARPYLFVSLFPATSSPVSLAEITLHVRGRAFSVVPESSFLGHGRDCVAPEAYPENIVSSIS